jgi:hypothetical protein
MRSYLQRAEVRLSTMHRIVSALLGGAGLLVLFPIFFGGPIASLTTVFIDASVRFFSSRSLTSPEIPILIISIPFVLSFALPVFALFLLLRDLVHFYFVGHSPGFPARLFSPRFALSGIGFSPNESQATKNSIEASQLSSDLINFVLPFGEAQAAYFGEVITSTRGDIIPAERTLENLVKRGVLTKVNGAYYSKGQHVAKDDIDRFNAALGLAGMRDRDLVDEVAKSEASLVRHALGLRRLLLRYMKALLMFIATALFSFFVVAVTDSVEITPKMSSLVLGLGYLAWSVATFWLVKTPIRWIYATADPRSQSVVQGDRELREFERWVRIGCAVSFVASIISVFWALSI